MWTINVTVAKGLFRNEVKPQARNSITAFIHYFRIALLSLYQLPKSGRRYVRYKPTKSSYVASAPGEAPAIRSGFLRDSFGVTWRSLTVADVRIGARYAGILEGLAPSTKMQPRPSVRPALKMAREQFGSVRDLI